MSHSVGSGPVEPTERWEGGSCEACGSMVTRPATPPSTWRLTQPPDSVAFVEREARDRQIDLSWTEGVDDKGDPAVTVSPGDAAGPVGIGGDRADAASSLARLMHWMR